MIAYSGMQMLKAIMHYLNFLTRITYFKLEMNTSRIRFESDKATWIHAIRMVEILEGLLTSNKPQPC